jgi:hypothetical protein
MVSEADDPSTDIKRPKRSSSARPKKSKRPKPPIPQTESEINAPDRLTLVALGAMGVVTLALWGFARGACNYHPPRETRRPRPVKIEELARDPKDAAMALQQRLLHLDFAGAADVATGEALAAVEKAKADCMTKPQDCAMQRKNREKHVLSTPALLDRQPAAAVVRVTSTVLGKTEVNLLYVERVGQMWKVSRRLPDDPSYKPQGPLPMGLELLPSRVSDGAASAAPEGSVPSPAPAVSGSAPPRTFVVKPPPAAPAAPPPAPAPSN